MALKPLGLKVASRRVLSDVVTDDLRQAIITHELEPGRRIAEDELALQMGVSRGPIREALMRLEREGLVITERHKGARVASWDDADIQEIYSMRSVLELLAIEWACKNATALDIEAMEDVLHNYAKLTEKQRTPSVVSSIDLDFHTALFAAAHHDRLLQAWTVLRSQILAFLVYTWSKDKNINKTFLPSWAPDHAALVEIIRNKQTKKAKDMVSAHVERGFQRAVVHFKEQPMPAMKD